MTKETAAKIKISLSMALFGSIGLFVRNVDLPAGTIAFARGTIGALFLYGFIKIRHKEVNATAILKNLPALIISGCFLGLSWVLLFEAYQRTTIATATLSYYFSPILMILLAIVILGEQLNAVKLLCTGIALVGLAVMSELHNFQNLNRDDLAGIGLGIGAAFLYAVITIVNKQLKNIDSYSATMIQLVFAALFMIPFSLITADLTQINLTTTSVLSLVVISVVHTGITYALFFSSLTAIKTQTLAIFTYIDPLVSVAVSALVLKESLSIWTYVGGVMILGAALVSELWDLKVKQRPSENPSY